MGTPAFSQAIADNFNSYSTGTKRDAFGDILRDLLPTIVEKANVSSFVQACCGAKTGLLFSKDATNANELNATRSLLDGSARVGVAKASVIQFVSLGSDLTCDLAASGAGGLDTGAAAANRFYDVRLVAKDDLSDPVLLATLTETSPILPVLYTYQSAILFGVFIQSIGPVIIKDFFSPAEGECSYESVSPPQILTNGGSLSLVALALAGALPFPLSASSVSLRTFAEETTSSNSDNLIAIPGPGGLLTSNSQLFWNAKRMKTTSYSKIEKYYSKIPLEGDDGDNLLAYWVINANAPTNGNDFYVLGWTLRGK